MNKFILTLATTLVLSGCGGDQGTNARDAASDPAAEAAMAQSTGAVGASVGPAGNTADTYVANAAISDLYEIASSRLALEKASSPAVKSFAQQMITDHTATSNQLKVALVEGNMKRTVPTATDERHLAMLDALKGLSGAAFDKAYLEQQATAHQEALLLHGSYADDGENDALQKLAAATAPKIQHHADMVKKLAAAANSAS
jgi:putative membrane protein